MALLLRKHADKSGPTPEQGQPWPLTQVEIMNEAPAVWEASDGFVDAGIADGWIEWAGKPLKYTVDPDPGGQFKFSGPQTLNLPGDRLVLKVVRDVDGEEREYVDSPVTYKITQPPIPRGFRVGDKGELSGFRANHSYRCELEA